MRRGWAIASGGREFVRIVATGDCQTDVHIRNQDLPIPLPMVLGHDRVLVGVSGRVIEVGVGNGLNFAHYPDSVTDVLAVESEDRLRARAEKAAGRARVPVRVVAGHAGALPAEDGEFDAAVAALVLCSVGDVDAALAEIRRVLRQLAGAAKGNPAACTAARRAQIIFVSCRS